MDKKYEVYLNERNSLINAELEQSRQFDRYILTLAAGTFGLSLLFIEQIAPEPESGTIWFLVTAWVVFGFSILSTLLSFLLSQKALSKQREILGQWYKEGNKYSEEDYKNWFAVWTGRLNWVSMFLFLIGVVFLTLFSSLNLLP